MGLGNKDLSIGSRSDTCWALPDAPGRGVLEQHSPGRGKTQQMAGGEVGRSQLDRQTPELRGWEGEALCPPQPLGASPAGVFCSTPRALSGLFSLSQGSG